jgi:class 3 adenylate cyclase/TolB-like protein
MRVLVQLAARPGRVVTRTELEESVWAGMVVGPDALTNAIIKLRKALGDDARSVRFIETIPKTGYRLVAPVQIQARNETEPALERKLAAILYADVAGYSRLTGEDEERTHRTLSTHLDLFADVTNAHKGTVVHYAGDAVLAEFETVTEALGCAVEIQRELRAREEAAGDAPAIQFRIGINVGEVIVDRDDIYGDGVNIAARLEGLADPGGICISESVRASVGNKLPLDYEFLGEQSVKNIADPVRAYRVLFYPSSQRPTPRARRIVTTGAVAAAAGVVVLAVHVLGQRAMSPEDTTAEEPTEAIATTDKPAIAVLPFANVNVDPDEEYFADGMTDDLITDLSKVSGLYVIARNSVFAYKNRAINVSEVGRELGAQYILEGSIRRAQDRVVPLDGHVAEVASVGLTCPCLHRDNENDHRESTDQGPASDSMIVHILSPVVY